jgi:magnesium-transporting ATPase (P-type)
MLSISDVNERNWHTLSVEETATAVKGNVSAGLTNEEALRRHQLFGPNRLTEEKHESFWQNFWKNYVSH